MKNYSPPKLVEKSLFNRRALILGVSQFAFIATLGWKMRQLQVQDSEKYKLLSDENRINIRILPPIRGVIFDREGLILATNEQNYRIVMIREETGSPEKVLNNLAKIIDLPSKEIKKIIKESEINKSFVPIMIAEKLTWSQFLKVGINLPSLPGILPEVGLQRSYDFDEIMAHIVGYVGPVSAADLKSNKKQDPLLQIPGFHVGKTGIEKGLDNFLKGAAGLTRMEVNARGRPIRKLDENLSKKGQNVQLTLDTKLQEFSMIRSESHNLASVVLDIKSGDILSLTSTPSFDPNKFVKGLSIKDWEALRNSKSRPLSNKAISGNYPPGSTFKMVVALAAMSNPLFNPEDLIDCEGHYELGERKFHCWRNGGHGKMNLENAMKQSCDVYFYKIAELTGIEKISSTANRLGLGQTFSLPLPGEAKGLIPTRGWKKEITNNKWRTGDTLNTGIGQGYVLTTPLQLAVMTARIASGKTVTPKIIKAINGRRIRTVKFPNLDISKKSLRAMNIGMYKVVNDKKGTAYKSRTSNIIEIAGKTGTVQIRQISKKERARGVIKNKDLPYLKRDHALFVGYAPFEKPQYAISIIVEHGGGGAEIAAPIARDILLFAMHGTLPPISDYPKDQQGQIRNKFESYRTKRDKVFKSRKDGKRAIFFQSGVNSLAWS